MSRRNKKCWICDKCGKIIADTFSTNSTLVLPNNWIFVNEKPFSKTCICNSCIQKAADKES